LASLEEKYYKNCNKKDVNFITRKTNDRQKEYTRNLTIPQKWQIKRQNNSVFAKYWGNMASKVFLNKQYRN
jgi:hypothetical protein